MASHKFIVLSLFLVCAVGCNSRQSSHDAASPVYFGGADWMAWNNSQRDAVVVGYIDGLREGIGEACEFAEGPNDMRNGALSDPSHDAVAKCRANTTKYSRCNEGTSKGPICGFYAQVITTFYTKHPEYQNMPIEYLMYYLSDKEHKNADDLCAMAKSGALRTTW